MNVDCLQDTVYRDPAHLCNYSSKNCPHFNHLTLLHYVNFVYNITNLVLCDTAFALMMIAWGSKHVVIFSVILWYKYLRNNIVHVVWVLCIGWYRVDTTRHVHNVQSTVCCCNLCSMLLLTTSNVVLIKMWVGCWKICAKHVKIHMCWEFVTCKWCYKCGDMTEFLL